MTLISTTNPSVSIIVPTFNRRERLLRLLDSLRQHYETGAPFTEVVVVIDGATDGTREALAALHVPYPLRVLEQANSGPAAARNRAIEASTGEVLLFLDDDVVPTPGMIERHLQVHLRDTMAVVTGPMLAPAGRTMPVWLHWEAAKLQKQYSAMQAGAWPPTPRQFYTANASVRRQYPLAAGVFNESLRRAEDVELAYRMAAHGLRFYFVPEAAVLHEPDRTFETWMRVMYQYGRHDVIMTHACGHSHVLPWNYRNLGRNPVRRLLLRAIVGHQWRLRALVAASRLVMKYNGPGSHGLPPMALCSAIASIQFWQGIANETGLGTDVWHGPEAWKAEVTDAERRLLARARSK